MAPEKIEHRRSSKDSASEVRNAAPYIRRTREALRAHQDHCEVGGTILLNPGCGAVQQANRCKVGMLAAVFEWRAAEAMVATSARLIA